MFEGRFKNVNQEIYIEANPFLHSKTHALKLVADIAKQESNTVNVKNHFEKVEKLLLSDEFKNKIKDHYGYECLMDVYNEYDNSKDAVLASTEDTSTKIVLAGQFSAGKSSFLNALFCKKGEAGFLPVDVKPTSVVPTYLYCNKNLLYQRIICENFKKAKMYLTMPALLAMGHEFQAKHEIGLMKFLNKIIIQQPVHHSWLDNLVFIDTPGYSKEDGDTSNGKSDGVSDRDTAKKELEQADVLIWLIDAGTPTLKQDDFEFIKHFDKNKPILFVLNKADKFYSADACKKAINGINDQVKGFHKLVDIVAFSALDNEFKGSLNNMLSWQSIFLKIKSLASGNRASDNFKNYIDEIKQDYIKTYLKVRGDVEQKIFDNNNHIINLSNKELYNLDFIKEDIEYYYGKAVDYVNSLDKFNDLYIDSNQREYQWEEIGGPFVFTDVSSLRNARSKDWNKYDEILSSYEGLLDKNENINPYLDEITNYLNDDLIENPKKNFISENEGLRKKLKEIENANRFFESLMNDVVSAWNTAIKELKRSDNPNSNFEGLNLVGNLPNVYCPFDAINYDDFESFVTFFATKKDVKAQIKSNFSLFQEATKKQRYRFLNFLLEVNPSCTSLINFSENNQISAYAIAKESNDTALINLFDKALNN